MTVAASIDPRVWLLQRGWTEYPREGCESYWRRSPNEPGWEGGWNLGGAVHRQLEAENTALLKSMGLYRSPVRRR